jgi:hypothetical protein
MRRGGEVPRRRAGEDGGDGGDRERPSGACAAEQRLSVENTNFFKKIVDNTNGNG